VKGVDFDDYAEQYETVLTEQLRFFESSSSYFAARKVQALWKHVSKEPASILEFGCGTGGNLRHIARLFPGARIYGCDISGKSLERAASENPGVTFFAVGEEGNGHGAEFDLILVANVFHHIPPPVRQREASKLAEWLADGGELFFFEHNPYNPVTRRLVSTCPFDRDAVLLRPDEAQGLMARAGLRVVMKKYFLFFPSFVGFLRPFEEHMGWIPLGGQYFLKALR
jgi:SAM-dependent methyltransferase